MVSVVSIGLGLCSGTLFLCQLGTPDDIRFPSRIPMAVAGYCGYL